MSQYIKDTSNSAIMYQTIFSKRNSILSRVYHYDWCVGWEQCKYLFIPLVSVLTVKQWFMIKYAYSKRLDKQNIITVKLVQPQNGISPETLDILSQTAKFMGTTWGPSGANRTQVGPMLSPRTLLSGVLGIVSTAWQPLLFPLCGVRLTWVSCHSYDPGNHCRLVYLKEWMFIDSEIVKLMSWPLITGPSRITRFWINCKGISSSITLFGILSR